MPIFRSAKPYIAAFGFQHLMLLAGAKAPTSNIKCWKPYAIIYGLALLKMGIVVPETC